MQALPKATHLSETGASASMAALPALSMRMLS